jgi:hypothetical protein
MNALGREFLLIVGASAIAVILFVKSNQTDAIIKQLGGSTSQVINALQGNQVSG